MRVLGVDPGGTTGLAVLEWDSYNKTVEVVDSLELALEAAMRWLYDSAVMLTVEGIGIERFVFTPRTTKLSSQYDAVYVIGAALCIGVNREIPIRMQSPADAKAAFGNENLKDLGAYVKGEHARDAARHALLYLRTLTRRV
jgi:hypothetical protein